MSIPLLEYAPASQNQRVNGFEVAGDEQPWSFTTDNCLSGVDLDVLILAAYRQIYNEQQMLNRHRQLVLESQLKANQITVREFIRGLLLSDSFRRLVYESNNNYRFVEICIQRVLGRKVYSKRETMTWSIVLATEGLNSFVNQLLSSEEYLSNFGDNTVPFQRRRILPQRGEGELPFARMARYGKDYRDRLPEPNLDALLPTSGYTGPKMSSVRWDWQKQPPEALQKAWVLLFLSGVAGLAVLFAMTLLGL